MNESAFVPSNSETYEPRTADPRMAIRTDHHGVAPSAAELTIQGAARRHQITLRTIAEEDGESAYEVLVNSHSLGRKTNPPTEQKRLRTALTFAPATPVPGDKIRVVFAGANNRKIPENGGFAHARGRWRELELAPLPLGKPSLLSAGLLLPRVPN